MSNKKLSVFFDTNSYRQIVLNKNVKEISELLYLIHSAEKENNIEPISTLTVNLELSSNLAEGKSGMNFENCLNGLRFLTHHCFDYEKKIIRIASLPFLQVSAMMFGALPIDFDIQEKRYKMFKESPQKSKWWAIIWLT